MYLSTSTYHSPRSFMQHHSQRLSRAAVMADAAAIYKKILVHLQAAATATAQAQGPARCTCLCLLPGDPIIFLLLQSCVGNYPRVNT